MPTCVRYHAAVFLNFLDLGLFCGAQVEEEEEKKKGKKEEEVEVDSLALGGVAG